MEIYIGPPDASVDAKLSREQVLAAFAQAGLTVEKATEEPDARDGTLWWTLSFRGSDVRLEFQGTNAGLGFATLEQSMFDNSGLPDDICRVLEELGWEVDQDSVG